MTREDRLAAILANRATVAGGLLPILHEVQHAFGCVDAAAEAAIAKVLNLSRAEVHGVVSFYPDFTATTDRRPCVQLCSAEACQARGGDAVIAAASAAAGDRVEIRTVFCLGLCSQGPAARIGNAVHARQTPETVATLVNAL